MARGIKDWLRANIFSAITAAAVVASGILWALTIVNGYVAKEWYGPTSTQAILRELSKTEAKVTRLDSGLARISDDRLLDGWRKELAKMRKAGFTPETIPADWYDEDGYVDWMFTQEQAKAILAARRAIMQKQGD